MYKYLELENKYVGYKIKAKEFLPESVKKIERVFIICHGFCSNKESNSVKIIAEKLNSNNTSTIAFDFVGHGESEVGTDRLTVENCITDIKTIEEYIKEKYINAKISIFAISFGAYITINKIIKEGNDYEFVVFRSPAIDMKNILINCLIKEDFSIYKEKGRVKAGYGGKIEVPYSFYEDLKDKDILKNYDKTAKILMFQGTKDDTSPISDTYKFMQIDSENLKLIAMKGVNHRMSQEEIETVAEQMNQYIKIGRI